MIKALNYNRFIIIIIDIIFRFYDLDLTLTLQENLENKIIVEFPTLHVVMKDHSNMYDIIDTGKYYSVQCYQYVVINQYIIYILFSR